jgi:polysaccharide pyruvyl transferase WcaK-like protein
MKVMRLTPNTEKAELQVPESCPRIALLTPYDGGNLGDAAIQDSMIANLRQRMPSAQFLGITLNCDNFRKQHGTATFPLLSASLPFTGRSSGNSKEKGGGVEGLTSESDYSVSKDGVNLIKRAFRIVPGLVPFLKKARAFAATVLREFSHSFEGYRVIRKQDLLAISGGGQLDDIYGGPWVHPYALCKWVLLARAARVPCAAVSIGACGKITSPTSRILFSTALRICCYRSYRDTQSRTIAASLLPRASDDTVVADLAFSLPDAEFPWPIGNIRKMARERPVVALSPIAYAKPRNWPIVDGTLHERYVQQMARVLSCLLRRGYFLVLVCSSRGDDEGVIPEILGRLDGEMKTGLEEQAYFPTITTWRDFTAVLRDSDFLIASRLHGTILGFVTQTPAIAISFNPKVDWVMEDLRQTDYLLQIGAFTAEEVLDNLDRIKIRREAVVEQIASYRQRILPESARQFDILAKLVLAHHQSHH